MQIPAIMLQQTVSVEKYEGEGAYGPTYGAAEDMACRIEPTNELVRDSQGNESVAAARAFFYPDAVLPPESHVTWEGTTYTVLQSKPQVGLDGRKHHVECWLR